MRRPKIEDYECNEDFAFDMGNTLEGDPDKRHNCSLCDSGKHDECQRREMIFCKCFLQDHEESW